jgi:hypothetical protein
MNAETSDRESSGLPPGGPQGKLSPGGDDLSEERQLSYEGAVVPRFLAVLWVVFLVWAVVYLVRLVPESMVEWFSRE